MALTRWISLITLTLLAAAGAFAQASLEIQADVVAAENAVREAEAAGAAVYATSLYEEARARLAAAKQNADHRSREVRETARLDALEAKLAAEAALAKTRFSVRAREANDLREDIGRFGGEVAAEPVPTEDPAIALERGSTTAERVAYAERVVAEAKAAGAAAADAQAIERAEELLESARRVSGSQRQSDTAEYLAYAAEMGARRALYRANLARVEGVLPGLRLERTRLAEQAKAREAAAERQRREQAEREMAELRAQLEAERQSRETSQAELEQLRRQVTENERRLQEQLEADRRARVEAEQRLIELGRQYESAVATRVDPVEVERLRRQIEDQQIALRAIGDRERLSEEMMQKEIARLQEELEAQRLRGATNLQELDQREAELDARARELAKLQSERELAEQRRAEAEAAFQQRIAELERRAQTAELERTELEKQVEAERARAAQAEAELARMREEAARREQAERDRIERMEKTLAEIAETRRDERGFIVTLPGIYFATGRTTLQSGARNTLARVAEQLRGNPELHIVVEGHTDSTGSEEVNQKLSEERAAAVRDFLVTQGIAPERIETVGRGEQAPIATNETAAGRQQNRRVELVIRTRR